MNSPMPKWLQYSIIFAVAACIGSVAAYYIDPTGLLCGVLAVIIFKQMGGGRGMSFFSEAGLEATGAISNKTKIRYLKRYIWLDREIDRKCNEISKLRANLTKVTPVYSNELKGGGSIYGKTEDIVARIVDLEAEINADIDHLVQLQKNIEHIVKAVENDQERLLLQYRYLDGQTFEWIAAQMNYHWRSIHKIHVRALSRLEIGQ